METFKLQNHVKPPPRRFSASEPSRSELAAFDAYAAAYRRCYGCKLDRVGFDSTTRNAIFRLPSGEKTGYNAKRCKELARQLNFRRERL